MHLGSIEPVQLESPVRADAVWTRLLNSSVSAKTWALRSRRLRQILVFISRIVTLPSLSYASTGQIYISASSLYRARLGSMTMRLKPPDSLSRACVYMFSPRSCHGCSTKVKRSNAVCPNRSLNSTAFTRSLSFSRTKQLMSCL